MFSALSTRGTQRKKHSTRIMSGCLHHQIHPIGLGERRQRSTWGVGPEYTKKPGPTLPRQVSHTTQADNGIRLSIDIHPFQSEPQVRRLPFNKWTLRRVPRSSGTTASDDGSSQRQFSLEVNALHGPLTVSPESVFYGIPACSLSVRHGLRLRRTTSVLHR